MEHLNPEIRAIALSDSATRIHHIETDKWISYTRAMDILKRLEHLLEYPRSHRMPNMLIVGETNNGKTALLNTFNQRHRPKMIPGQGVQMPVLMIEAPSVPDEQRLYNQILHALMAPYRINERVEKKHFQIMELFGNLNLRMLIIDELHSILHGTYKKQRIFLNVLKFLANQLKIVIVCAGTKDAGQALASDDQLANRFERYKLPRWKMDEEYLRLLLSFEVSLPLRSPSNLLKRDLAETILQKSEGTIGEIATILKNAAILAIESGKEQITRSLLEEIIYVMPSKRKKESELS